MSQRGGAVVSHLRISDVAIAADLIPKGSADLILAVEPMEALRYLPFLAPNAYVVTNITPVLNVPNYPDIKEVLNEIKKQPKHVAIDADKIAAEIGNKRASNMVMLGAAAPFIHIDSGKVEAGIERIFGSKGREVVDLNIQAFRAGMQFALERR
jgi:indolepyruvate ferredoxin oxidoreductase, beta subunit